MRKQEEKRLAKVDRKLKKRGIERKS